MNIAPGTRLGRYEIRSLLGAGGMGEVYRARDTELRRDVALKVLPATLHADAERLRRFEQEARSAGLLNHPNIVVIYDIGERDGAPYVVSEFLEGETLRERLHGVPLPQRKVTDYALQIARGLAAAHEKGIIHRDLKPENLFITKDGRVKILDFGLAKLISPLGADGVRTDAPTLAVNTDPGRVMGTVGYMSPEQVRGHAVDHRSDIFTFGAILYEMLAGRRAFRGDSAVETLNAILKEEPPDLIETNRNVAPSLERLVRRCLDKSPEQRFQSASDLAFALESLSGLTSQQSASVRASALAAGGQTRRRRLAPSLIVGAVLFTVAVAVATFFVGRQSSDKPQPTFQRITFRRGTISAARFAPDAQTIIYSAAFQGKPLEVFTTRSESPESRALGIPEVNILAVSSTSEMALRTGRSASSYIGTLARAPLAGGAPREVLNNVAAADWSPDGASLAVARAAEGRFRLEFPIGKILYEGGTSIDFLRVSPRGDRIAFIEQQTSLSLSWSVAVVDLAGNKRVLADDQLFAEGLAWTADGNEIWFTSGEPRGATTIHAVTLAGKQRVVARLDGSLNLQDISREGRVLLLRHNTRTEIVAALAGETRERDLSWLDSSHAGSLTADGKMFLVVEDGQGGGNNRTTYLRKTDGSPALRLGEGAGFALSPDGKWTLMFMPSSPPQLTLLPTGAGEPKPLKTDPVTDYTFAQWFPDGKRILISGSEPGHAVRCYVQDLEGGAPLRAITPEGASLSFNADSISPDGKFVVTIEPGRKVNVYPVEGGAPVLLTGLTAGELPIRWSQTGRAIYVRERGVPTKIYRYDIETQRKEFWKELIPADAGGVTAILYPLITPDGKTYVYTYGRTLSELYLVEGLK
jgi:serine/threonine protein kinase/Tol biopolymer transport system component